MSACPACRAALPEGARFCPACGTRLVLTGRPDAERKMVTTLFADLVGFTRMAEGADPEDVDRVLREFAEMATHAVEIHGGIVEKFIGDAVVAVFGVPTAHEDDAERAVHAALRINQDAPRVLAPDGSPVRVRTGVNTGEALARLSTDARSGEGFLAGDAVNTAARLQNAAPPGGILVGPTTYALTSRLFRFEELEPVQLKGKAESTPVWLVHAAVSGRVPIGPPTSLQPSSAGEASSNASMPSLARSSADGTPGWLSSRGSRASASHDCWLSFTGSSTSGQSR